jgi:hypothetical protein
MSNNEVGNEVFVEANRGNVAVWAFVTVLLWTTFAIALFLAMFNLVSWAAPVIPLLLGVLSLAASPANRLLRAAQEASRNMSEKGK